MSEHKVPTGSHQIRVERFDTFEAAQQIWVDLEAHIVAVFLGKPLLMLESRLPWCFERKIRRTPGLHRKINQRPNRRGETTGQSGDGP